MSVGKATQRVTERKAVRVSPLGRGTDLMIKILSVRSKATQLFTVTLKRVGCNEVPLGQPLRWASEVVFRPIGWPAIPDLPVKLFVLVAVENAARAGESSLAKERPPKVKQVVRIPQKGKLQALLEGLLVEVW